MFQYVAVGEICKYDKAAAFMKIDESWDAVMHERHCKRACTLVGASGSSARKQVDEFLFGRVRLLYPTFIFSDDKAMIGLIASTL